MATKQREPEGMFRVEDVAGALVDIEARLHHVPWERGIRVCLVGRSRVRGQQYAQVTNMMLEPVSEGQELRESFRLTRENAQGLMDELWRVGVRPSQEMPTGGELAATKRHLQDMRVLVGKAMDIADFWKQGQ